MDLGDIFSFFIAAIGTGGVVSSIYLVYVSRIKKRILKADLIQKTNEEWQKLYNTLQPKIEELERKVERLELMHRLEIEAFDKWKECEWLPVKENCPIITHLNKIEARIEKK